MSNPDLDIEARRLRLDSLPPLRDVISAHGLQAKKSLGQNFLLDQNITDKIVRLCGISEGLNVIEIGPGPGGLTRSLLRSPAAGVWAVEADFRAVAALSDLNSAAAGRLHILQGDALAVDARDLCAIPRAVIANLPYNIATPLLLGWLQHLYEDQGAYAFLALMFQKEVAQRICAAPSGKAYGRLAVISQWLCEAKILVELPPSVFTPPPKVRSAVVKLVPRQLPADSPPFAAVERVTALAFQGRRKMVRSSLAPYEKHFEEAGIDPQARAENLSVAQYIRLAQLGGDPVS